MLDQKQVFKTVLPARQSGKFHKIRKPVAQPPYVKGTLKQLFRWISGQQLREFFKLRCGRRRVVGQDVDLFPL